MLANLFLELLEPLFGTYGIICPENYWWFRLDSNSIHGGNSSIAIFSVN